MGTTMRSKQPCTWNGVTYPSIREAARAVGVSHATMVYRLRSGYTSDEDLSYGYAVTWEGVQYASIGQAARAAGITPAAMKYRLDRGYASESDMTYTHTEDDIMAHKPSHLRQARIHRLAMQDWAIHLIEAAINNQLSDVAFCQKQIISLHQRILACGYTARPDAQGRIIIEKLPETEQATG